MGEWHLYKPSDSLGDKLCHQSECSHQVHLEPAPLEPCQPPSPKCRQLSSQPHIFSLARPCPALPCGCVRSKAKNPGTTPQPSMAPMANLRKWGTPKLPGKVQASQQIKQPSGWKSLSLQSHCLPGLDQVSVVWWNIAILVPRASVFYHAPRTLYFLLSLPRSVSLLVYRTHSCSFCKSDSSQSCFLFMVPIHSSCSTNTS